MAYRRPPTAMSRQWRALRPQSSDEHGAAIRSTDPTSLSESCIWLTRGRVVLACPIFCPPPARAQKKIGRAGGLPFRQDPPFEGLLGLLAALRACPPAPLRRTPCCHRKQALRA